MAAQGASLLLVPNGLATKATQLTRDTEVRDTTASTKYTTTSAHTDAGRLSAVSAATATSAAASRSVMTRVFILPEPDPPSGRRRRPRADARELSPPAAG